MTHCVPLFTFQFELEVPTGKIYNLRLLFEFNNYLFISTYY